MHDRPNGAHTARTSPDATRGPLLVVAALTLSSSNRHNARHQRRPAKCRCSLVPSSSQARVVLGNQPSSSVCLPTILTSLASPSLVCRSECTRVKPHLLLCSDTTRSPRPGEVDGKDYHFVSRDDFTKLLKSDGFFIEHAEFSRNLYGTSRRAVEKVQAEGRRCILDIEAQV